MDIDYLRNVLRMLIRRNKFLQETQEYRKSFNSFMWEFLDPNDFF